MLRLSVAIALLAGALRAPAAEVRVSDEVPLTPAGPLVPARGAGIPAVASNGDGFLALFGKMARFDANARLIGAPTAAPASSSLIARNGDGYLVATGSTSVQRLDANGRAIGDPIQIPCCGPGELLSNGDSTLVVFQDESSALPPSYSAVIVDRNGLITPVYKRFFGYVGAAVHDGKYVIADYGPGGIAMNSIADDGRVSWSSARPSTIGCCSFVTAFSEDSMIVVGRYETALDYELIPFDGSAVITGTTAAPPNPYVDSILYDGRAFMVTFAAETGSQAIRISKSGVVIDERPVSVRNGFGRRLASNGRGLLLLVWLDHEAAPYGTPAWRSIRSLDELVTTRDEAAIFDFEGRMATRPRIARAGSAVAALWFDNDVLAWRGSIGDVSLSLPPFPRDAVPSLIAGDRTLLVTWYEMQRRTLFGSRIAFDGSLLDAQPLALITDSPDQVGITADFFCDVAFDGFAYQTVSTIDNDLHGQRLTEEGTLIDPFAVHADATRIGARLPRIAFPDAKTFISYVTSQPRACTDQPSCYDFVLKGTMLETLLSAAARAPLFVTNANAMETVAVDDRVSFAWLDVVYPEYQDIVVAQSTIDAPTAGPVVLAHYPDDSVSGQRGISAPQIAWDGTQVVIAWTEGNRGRFNSTSHRILAMRLTRDLAPIDAAPFVIATNVATGDAPSLAATPAGVAVAYSRFGDDATRVYVRTILKSNPPRRRGVRH